MAMVLELALVLPMLPWTVGKWYRHLNLHDDWELPVYLEPWNSIVSPSSFLFVSGGSIPV